MINATKNQFYKNKFSMQTCVWVCACTLLLLLPFNFLRAFLQFILLVFFPQLWYARFRTRQEKKTKKHI